MDRTLLQWVDYSNALIQHYKLCYKAEVKAEVTKFKGGKWTLTVISENYPNRYERLDEAETAEEAKALAETLVIFDN